MKNVLLILTLVVFGNYTSAQVSGCHNILQNKINEVFSETQFECEASIIENEISEFNKKMEIWNICKLKNGNRIIRIESHKNDTSYQEIYFEMNGKLRYIKKTENYKPKNEFTKIKSSSEFFLEREIVVSGIIFSPEHRKNIDEKSNSESIMEMYKKRISELNGMKK